MKNISFYFFIFLSFILNTCSEKNSKDIKKIILFGDSLMSGYGLSEENHLHKILEKDFMIEGFEINIINKSISGDTTADGLARLEESLKIKDIDLIILGLGANDMLRGIDTSIIKQNLEEIIKRIQNKNIEILFTGMVATTSRGLSYKKKFDQIYEDLSKEYKLNYMPFLLKGVALKPEYNQSDGIHPNFEGLKIISKNLKKSIINLM